MKQKKTNVELQSRREFFKKAAKAALPVVGAVVLSGLSFDSNASQLIALSCNGCEGSCRSTCSGSCSGSCRGDCNTTCKGSCDGSCNSGCGTECKN